MATYLLVEQCDFHATHIVSERSTGTFGITGFRKAVCEIQVVELDIIVAKPVVVTGTCTSTTSATPRHGLQASTGDRGPTIAPHPVFGQALAWTNRKQATRSSVLRAPQPPSTCRYSQLRSAGRNSQVLARSQLENVRYDSI